MKKRIKNIKSLRGDRYYDKETRCMSWVADVSSLATIYNTLCLPGDVPYQDFCALGFTRRDWDKARYVAKKYLDLKPGERASAKMALVLKNKLASEIKREIVRGITK